MPRNINGVALIPPGTKGQPNTVIQSAPYNNMLDDVYNEITESLPRDGRAAMYGDLSMANNRITGLAEGQVDGDAVTVAQLEEAVASIPTIDIPSGAVMPFAMSEAPAGWLACRGQAVSRSDYAALFAAIGTTYGSGNGSSTFNLPNLRGQFVRGWNDSASGPDANREFGSVQASQNLAHNHTASTGSSGSHSHSASSGSAGSHSHTGTAAEAGAHAHSGSAQSAGSHSHSGSTSTDTHTHTIQAKSGTSGGAGPDVALSNSQPGSGGSWNNSDVVRAASDSHSHTLSINSGGAHTHTLSINSNGAHTHSVSTNSTGAHTHSVSVESAGAHTHTVSVANDGGSEARPTSIALLYCIKA